MRHRDFSVVYCGSIVQADLLKCLLEGQGIHAWLEMNFSARWCPTLRLAVPEPEDRDQGC